MKDRLTGFEGEATVNVRADWADFPNAYGRGAWRGPCPLRDGPAGPHLSEADADAVGRDLYYLLNQIEHNGGGPLFGIKGNVIVGHGRARVDGISRAVHTAVRVCEIGLAKKMEEELNSLRTRTAQ